MLLVGARRGAVSQIDMKSNEEIFMKLLKRTTTETEPNK